MYVCKLQDNLLLIRWEVVRKETVVENKELGEDQVELNIISGNDLDVVLAAEKCNTISISYNLGISSSGSGSGSETTDTGRHHIKINVTVLCI